MLRDAFYEGVVETERGGVEIRSDQNYLFPALKIGRGIISVMYLVLGCSC